MTTMMIPPIWVDPEVGTSDESRLKQSEKSWKSKENFTRIFAMQWLRPVFLNRWAVTHFWHLHLDHQNLRYCTMMVVNGSPNCVLFCYVGRQLPNVEND